VRRIVATISGDDMEGRRAYTPGIERAAEFLESEMTSIGLDPLAGANGFRQQFTSYQLTPTAFSVVLDGMPVDDGNVFFLVNSDSLNWTTGDAEIVVVGPGEDLGALFGRARRAPHDLMVLVDPSNEALFRRIQLFLAGGSRMLGLGKAGNVVFVLTDDLSPSEIRVTADIDIEALPLTNLVGQIEGNRPHEIVLFSAHYDHLGIQSPVDGDSVANGANDDASGVAAVLELARYYKAVGKPERTLMFALFTAEEMGGYGSYYFSEQVNPDSIVAMFNIEMIGKPAVSGPNSGWITGFDKSDLGEIMQRAVEGTEYTFTADPYPQQNLFFRSDNANLARKGVPAHTISTTPIDVDEDYHKVSDELEKLDVDHMTNTIKAILAGARTVVSGEATPSRIEMAPAGH